jgi:hypothetical protein
MSTPKIHVNESMQAVNDKSWVMGEAFIKVCDLRYCATKTILGFSSVPFLFS